MDGPDLIVGIGGDNSGLNDALRDSEAQIKSFFKNLEGLNRIGEQISSIGQKLTVGLTLPIIGLGAGALKAYGDIQPLQKGLEAVMGSAGDASKEFEQLKVVSRLPGLGMEEAVRGSINLQAIGIDAEKSRKILSQFGNAVASVGKGKAEFERAIYGVQQLANTDFPLGEDLNIIKDALPQVSNLLKEAFGSSRSDELAKMGVSSKQVLDTITKGLEKLPRVTGGINGAFENLGDSMKTSLARIGKIIDDTFDISGIIDKLTGYLDTAISYFEGLSPAVQKTILVVTGLVAAAGPLLIVIGGLIQAIPVLIAGIGGVGIAFTALTGPIGLVVIGIGAIIAAVVSNWGKIKPYIIDSINYFRYLYNESTLLRVVIQALVTNFRIGFSLIVNILKTAYEIFKTFVKGTADLFGGVGSVIKGALTGNLDEIKNGLSKIAVTIPQTLGTLGNDLKKGFTDAFTDAKSAIKDGLNNVTNSVKLNPITDLNIFDENKIVEKAGAKAKVLGKKVKDKVKAAIEEELSVLSISGKGLSNGLGQYFDTPLDFDNWFSGLTEGLKSLDGKVKETFSGLQLSIAENIIGIQDQFAQMADFGNFLGDSIGMAFNSVVDTIANSFSAIGEAMATGGNIFSAAGNAILGGIGAFLSELGKQMIQYGVAALAMAVLSKLLLNPITAAPAAVALIAAGAVLSAIGGAIKGTLSGGASGGGGSVSGSGGGSNSYSSGFSSGGGSGEVVFRISGNDLVGVLSRQQDKNSRIGG